MVGECSKILSRQKTLGDLYLQLWAGSRRGAGWGCRAGGHPPRSPTAARSHARPGPKPPAAAEAVGFRKGSEPDCHGGSDFRPGVTLLSASNAAPGARGAGSPTALARLRPRGVESAGLRGSSTGSQPCGSRTRLRGCNLSQDRPIVPVRSRLLNPGSARPVRSWSSASWFSPAREQIPRHARHGPAVHTGKVGLLGQGSFALCFGATVKLLSSARQGGRHIAKAQHAPLSTACPINQTSSSILSALLKRKEGARSFVLPFPHFVTGVTTSFLLSWSPLVQ